MRLTHTGVKGDEWIPAYIKAGILGRPGACIYYFCSRRSDTRGCGKDICGNDKEHCENKIKRALT